MPLIRNAALLGGFLLAIGCNEEKAAARASDAGESRKANDAGEPLAAKVLAGEVAVYTDLCKCSSAIGQPDPTTCFATFVGNGTRARTPSEAACVQGVFEAHAVEVDSILECELSVIATARACFAEAVDCEAMPVIRCAADGQAANTACGAYPAAVQRGINECYGLAGDGAAESAPSSN